MRRMNARLTRSLENEEILTAPASTDEVIAIDEVSEGPIVSEDIASDAVEATQEIVDAAEEHEGAVVELENVEQVAEDIVAVKEHIEDAVEDGGLTEKGAEALQVAVESIYQRLGLKPLKVSNESFTTGHASDRIRATKASLEEIKDIGKKVWKYIVDLIERIGTYVANFVKTYVVGLEKISKRADSVIASAKETKGEAKEATFAKPSIFKALQVGGKVASDLSAEITSVKELLADAADVSASSGKMVATLLQSAGKEGFVKKLALPKLTAKGIVNDLGDGVSEAVLSLPGGKEAFVVGATTEVKGEEAVKVFGKLNAGIRAIDGEVVKPVDIAILTPEEVVKVATGAKEVIAIALKSRAIVDANKAAKGKIVAFANKVPEDAPDAKASQEALKGLAVYMDKPTISAIKYATGFVNAVLDYGVSSLRAAKGQKAEEVSEEAKTA